MTPPPLATPKHGRRKGLWQGGYHPVSYCNIVVTITRTTIKCYMIFVLWLSSGQCGSGSV